MMTDNTNIENLRKLLTFLKQQILSNPQNKWFAKDLYDIIAPSTDGKITDIYELCIEDIIRHQAEEYYRDFVLEDIRDILVKDFVKMEHWRRRNNLDEFGLAVYQQVECIVNRLSRDLVVGEVFRTMQNALCYVDSVNPVVENRYAKSTYTIGRLLFMNDAPKKSLTDLSAQWAFDKFKSINYFVCHRACLTNHEFTAFNDENNTFSALYTLRNKNHRGNQLTEKEISRLSDIEKNPSRTYLLFSAFLNWFTESVNKGFPLSAQLISFSKQDFSAVRTAPIGPKILGKIDLPYDHGKKKKR